jgi:ATP-dependent protease ClpP protease subunit
MCKNNEIDKLKEFGSISPINGLAVVSIFGQIEGHYPLNDQSKSTKYEHILPTLVDIQENKDIQRLLILINTVGGDVESGLSIAETIASISKPTVSLVLGGGHSIGVPLAVSAKKSFIVPSATMTIHPVRTSGTIIGVPQSFNNFEKMQDRINNFIVKHSQISLEKLNLLLKNVGELVTDVGSMIDGYKAVEYGLIDKVGGLSDALNELNNMNNAKTPSQHV